MAQPEDHAGRESYLGGREHAKIKHVFLERYLSALAFKTLQAQERRRAAEPTFAYIDGFTGPWGAKDENYSDTSFGIALDVLNGVKERLPSVRIRCVFCESRQSAFQLLEDYVKKNAGPIEPICIPSRFEENIGKITQFVGRSGFLFAFLDPKGWRVDTTAIAPLLRDRWSEVVFTFMAEFIGRFPDYEKVQEAYASLFGDMDWRARFEATPWHLSNDERLFLLFQSMLKERWGFQYVLDFPIRKVDRNRTFYQLVYGTRSPHGVLTFRAAQAKAEKEGYAIFSEAEQSEQPGLFSADQEAEQIAAAVGVGSRAHAARIPEEVIRNLRQNGRMTFLMLTAGVLENVPVLERNVKASLRLLQHEGKLTYSDPDRNGNPSSKSTVWIADKLD